MTPQEPDPVLVARAVAGDTAAFAQLVERYGPRLYGFAVRHVPQAEDAHDAVQETFIAAWSALRRYDADRPLYVWLRSILYNRCRDLMRKAAVRRLWTAFSGTDAAQIDAVVDPAPPVEQLLTRAEAQRRFETALDNLPRPLREVLVLTQWDGLSNRETAELLGIAVKAVENRLYKARRKLAATLLPADLADLREQA